MEQIGALIIIVVILVLIESIVDLRLVLLKLMLMLLVRRTAPALHLWVFHFIDLVDVTVA